MCVDVDVCGCVYMCVLGGGDDWVSGRGEQEEYAFCCDNLYHEFVLIQYVCLLLSI